VKVINKCEYPIPNHLLVISIPTVTYTVVVILTFDLVTQKPCQI